MIKLQSVKCVRRSPLKCVIFSHQYSYSSVVIKLFAQILQKQIHYLSAFQHP